MNVRLIACVSATRHQFRCDLLNKEFVAEILYCRKCAVEFDMEIPAIALKSPNTQETFSVFPQKASHTSADGRQNNTGLIFV